MLSKDASTKPGLNKLTTTPNVVADFDSAKKVTKKPLEAQIKPSELRKGWIILNWRDLTEEELYADAELKKFILEQLETLLAEAKLLNIANYQAFLTASGLEKEEVKKHRLSKITIWLDKNRNIIYLTTHLAGLATSMSKSIEIYLEAFKSLPVIGFIAGLISMLWRLISDLLKVETTMNSFKQKEYTKLFWDVFSASQSTAINILNILCLSFVGVIGGSAAAVIGIIAIYGFIPTFGIICGLAFRNIRRIKKRTFELKRKLQQFEKEYNIIQLNSPEKKRTKEDQEKEKQQIQDLHLKIEAFKAYLAFEKKQLGEQYWYAGIWRFAFENLLVNSIILTVAKMVLVSAGLASTLSFGLVPVALASVYLAYRFIKQHLLAEEIHLLAEEIKALEQSLKNEKKNFTNFYAQDKSTHKQEQIDTQTNLRKKIKAIEQQIQTKKYEYCKYRNNTKTLGLCFANLFAMSLTTTLVLTLASGAAGALTLGIVPAIVGFTLLGYVLYNLHKGQQQRISQNQYRLFAPSKKRDIEQEEDILDTIEDMQGSPAVVTTSVF